VKPAAVIDAPTQPQCVRVIFATEPDAATIARHEEFVAECVRRIVAPPS